MAHVPSGCTKVDEDLLGASDAAVATIDASAGAAERDAGAADGSTRDGSDNEPSSCMPNPDTADQVCPEICPETCNGTDDDCDRRIDEGNAAEGCDLANASAACASGSCVVVECDSGFGDCDGRAPNGCEAELTTDPHNCGVCGADCSSLTHAASSICGPGFACLVDTCEAGWADCDGNGTSCEAPLDAPQNCGACGVDCTALAQVSAAMCSPGGACVIIDCDGGFENCDGVVSNGCERESTVQGSCCDPLVDEDGDGLDACQEIRDGSPWTDDTVFNGMHVRLANQCNATGACASVDTLAEVDACMTLGAVEEEHDQYAGWDWGNAPDDVCNPAYGFLPNWMTCDTTWQTDWQGFVYFESSGNHCFGVSGGTIGGCSALFFNEQTEAIQNGESRCFDAPAGAYPIRWHHTMIAGSNAAMHVNYCFGGASSCAPASAIPSSMLRAASPCPSCATGNPCAIGTCNIDGTCSGSTAPSGTPCADDGDPCTSDVCSGTNCTHPPMVCAPDAYSCTADMCQAGTCSHPLTTGCLITYACVAEGTQDPANACRQCNSSVSATNYSSKSNGTACPADTYSCTADYCTSGTCTHPITTGCLIAGVCIAQGTQDPANACRWCNGVVSATSYSNRANGTACMSDADACTSDVCSAGVCSHPVLDSDADGTPDCTDGCPSDPATTMPPCAGCFAASNFDSALYTYTAAVDLSACATTAFTYNSTTNSFTPATWCGVVPGVSGSVAQTVAGGPTVDILRFSSFNLPLGKTLTVSGTEPVIFAVNGNATISGTIDVSSTGTTTRGAASDWNCTTTATGQGADGAPDPGPETGGEGDGGGGGGGHSFAGGVGGNGHLGGAGGAAGAAQGTATIEPLRGGCDGGKGGDYYFTGAANYGGYGGGAVQISASGTLTVSGTIDASGGRGQIGNSEEDGGGAGGSGGAILLEGATVTTSGAVLRATGGGGAEGCGGTTGLICGGSLGADGRNGGAGGAGGAADAGDGGAGRMAGSAGANGLPGTANGGGGGGGGGAGGRIVVRTLACMAAAGYRKKLTIPAAQVTAMLTDFPVLVRLASDANLAARARADGLDLVFKDATGTTVLAFERESWTKTTGALLAWVKLPSVSSLAATDFYLYYGDNSSTERSNKPGTWSNGFKGVWHLDADFADSTGTLPTGTNSGTTNGTGQIGDGDVFTLADHISIGTGVLPNNVYETVTAWLKHTRATGDANDSFFCNEQMAVPFNGVCPTLRSSDGALGDYVGGFRYSTTDFATNGAWTFVGLRYYKNATGVIESSVNGEPWQSVFSGSTTDMTNQSDSVLWLGNWAAGGQSFEGTLDEVHFVTSATDALGRLSNAWIKAEYDNQKTASTFLAVGVEEAL